MEARVPTQQAQKSQVDRRVELRSNRRKAIDSLDFDRAEELDRELDAEKPEEVIVTFDDIKSELVAKFQMAVKRGRAFEAEITRESVRSKQSVQRRYHRLFTEIQQQHLAALAQLESQYADNRLRENGRCIPEQTILLEQAKRAAFNGDYATARETRGRSRVAALKTLENRLGEMTARFKTSRLQLIEAQKRSIIAFSERFASATKKIDDETAIRLSGNLAALEEALRAIYAKLKYRITKDVPLETLVDRSEASTQRSSVAEEPPPEQGDDGKVAQSTPEEIQQRKLRSLQSQLQSVFDDVCRECGILKPQVKMTTD
jgi:hypothetical protein